ncbi:hypothetical protein [Symbiobacterium thermophilum]|uniref:hypothetical protein n=1 Tax=Symbiobacterium thermophilum TaxID=2734 RepID=UPI0035C74227
MTVQATTPATSERSGRIPRAVPVLAFLCAALVGLWWRLPLLVAPVADFEQGPGGTEAYVTVATQIREQSASFWTGGDVHLRLSEAEVSGMLSSALLSGGSPDGPLARVRGGVDDGVLLVEAVMAPPADRVPARLAGPVGLRLRLAPEVDETGVIQFRITGAHVGKIPVSPHLIRLAGWLLQPRWQGYDAREAAFILPVSDMISQALGRRIEIRSFTAGQGQLSLTIAMPEY